MTYQILARPKRDVTSLLAPTMPTAQKNSETMQIVTIPKTTGEVTP